MRQIKDTEMEEKYIFSAISHGESSDAGDYKNANKQYSSLKKIYNKLEKDISFAENFLLHLLDHQNVFVRTWAAAHALGLNLNVEKAKNILITVSLMDGIGVVRLDAEMTLKQWEEQGYLKF